MEWKNGEQVYFIFKENIDKDKGEGYKLIAKSGILGEKQTDSGEYSVFYTTDWGTNVEIVRNGNNIFDSKEKCEKAITKIYQNRIYNFLSQAIDIFERYLKD